MSDYKPLDSTADVLPVGLQPTPFGEVWQALQQVAASVWDVDPSVYRAGMAWLWYAVNHPNDLASDSLRALLVVALISEQAPMVKDWQTNAELVEYLRVWRTYSPTYAKLDAIFATFGARVEVRPISDAESQGVVPVTDRRLAFYLRVEDFDAERPLTLDEVYQIAVRATPLGSRPVPYFALVGSSDVFAGPASAGLARVLWAAEPASAPPMSFVVVDSATGAIVHGFNQELTTYELPSVVLNNEDGYETYELPSIPLAVPKMVIGVPITGPVQAFWFTDNGQAETVDTELVIRNGLRDADGVKVKSVDSTDYQGANVLAYMKADGDMFTSSEASFTWFGSDSLRQLFVSNQDARGKSAWSVFAAKLFHLSFVNTQLPDVTIELPAAVVDTYGTSITLPTIDGEYESGGKTWKPSAWDIGAFGSSYSLTADTVAHLVFEEVQQYQEITLYLASNSNEVQKGVTSQYTGSVSGSNAFPLFYDQEHTNRFEYDYSNNYEVGEYVDGVWTALRDSISDLPDSTAAAADSVKAYILYDTGELWICSNSSASTAQYDNKSQITVRIYPKGQHYAGYLAYNNAYNNTTVTTATKGTYPAPTNGSQSNTSGWFFTFPKATITRLFMSAGNESQSVSGDEIAASTSYRMIFRQASAMSRTFRAIEYTLDRPTLHAWLKTDHTNKSTTSAALNDLYDDDGNLLMFDGDTSAVYVPIGVYTSTGANCSNNQLTLERSKFGRRSSGEWCFIQNYSTVSIARVWYVKYTDCKVAYFNANKTNYTWTQGTTRVLYDANGNQIPYDSTKTYTIIQLRESSHSVITPTFGDLALKSLINNLGYLACNAASGGTYSSLSVASVWYLEE